MQRNFNGIQIDNCDTLAVCTLSGESAVRVGQVNVGVRAAGNRESRTVIIKNVEVVDNLNITATKPKDLSRWPHLKGILFPEVDETEVNMLIRANVPRCLENDVKGEQENHMLCASCWVGLFLDQ